MGDDPTSSPRRSVLALSVAIRPQGDLLTGRTSDRQTALVTGGPTASKDRPRTGAHRSPRAVVDDVDKGARVESEIRQSTRNAYVHLFADLSLTRGESAAEEVIRGCSTLLTRASAGIVRGGELTAEASNQTSP